MMNHIAYIGIGSNLDDRHGSCVRAVEQIRWNNNIDVVAVSKWRETKAVTANDERQPHYINGAIKVLTSKKPKELLKMLKNIENEMGRPPDHPKWSQRKIDLDILFYDDIVVDEVALKIPHPEMQKRIFVLEPLCDIEPGLVHPVLMKRACELLKEAKK